MIYIAYKVLTLTKCRNYRVMFLVIFINLTLISHIVTESYIIHIKLSTIYDYDPKMAYIDNFLEVMPTLFFLITLCINLNSWAFYFIKIREMACAGNNKLEMHTPYYE